MSSDLRSILRKVADEDYKAENVEIEEGLERYSSLLLKIAKAEKWDVPIWVEGSDAHFQKYEITLNLSERGKLVKGQMKYTEHNAYREYTLTIDRSPIWRRNFLRKPESSIDNTTDRIFCPDVCSKTRSQSEITVRPIYVSV